MIVDRQCDPLIRNPVVTLSPFHPARWPRSFLGNAGQQGWHPLTHNKEFWLSVLTENWLSAYTALGLCKHKPSGLF
jgi:hypothetical protein